MTNCQTLNDEQKKAVTHGCGPMIIAAGPGTGKTRTLISRIIYLLNEKKILPENILAVTFTNKTAKELKERIEATTAKNINLITIGTFHSICFKVLKNEIHHLGYTNSFSLYDESSRQEVLAYLLANNNSFKELHPSIKKLSSLLSKIKNMNVTFEDTPEYIEVYDAYQTVLKENNALDLDDLVVLTNKLFNTCGSVLHHYQEKFHYILVDEYQDINYPQYLFIGALAGKRKNICVIGDADQAIYSFRGANVKNFLLFQRDYPDAVLIKLEQNYRSTPIIIEASSQMISKNIDRLNTTLWTDNKFKGNKITVIDTENEKQEAKKIVRIIEELMGGTSFHSMSKTERGTSVTAEAACFSDFCVLYRMHSLRAPIKEAFFNAGIPIQSVDGINLYNSFEVKQVLSYLRVLNNSNDNMSLITVLHIYQQQIGKKTISSLMQSSMNKKRSCYSILRKIDSNNSFTKRQKKAVHIFISQIDKLRDYAVDHPVGEVIRYILDHFDIKKKNLEKTSSKQIEDISHLISLSIAFSTLSPKESLEKFLQEVTLLSSKDGYNPMAKAVTVSSIHAVKGLEFPVVFIVGVEDGLIPFHGFENPDDEEERRLFYVAMTRAKKQLYCLHTTNRWMYGQRKKNKISPFLNPISSNYLDFIKEQRKPRVKKKRDSGQMSLFNNELPRGKPARYQKRN